MPPFKPSRTKRCSRSPSGRRKAEAYAEGVGAKLGRLMQLVEPSSESGRPAGIPGAVYAASPAPESFMPVERGEHDVSAQVNVTFALELA